MRLRSAHPEDVPLTTPLSREIRHDGSCLCGRVQYRIEGPVGNMSNCHCSDCRKHSGAAFVSFVEAPKQALSFVSGEDQLTTHQAASGTRRRFCRNCGSSLFCYVETDDLVEIAAATLDTPLSLRPEYHIYVRSKVSWFDIQDGKPQHQASSLG
jgi:hypothetical protein